jgi:hypothetical protein
MSTIRKRCQTCGSDHDLAHTGACTACTGTLSLCCLVHGQWLDQPVCPVCEAERKIKPRPPRVHPRPPAPRPLPTVPVPSLDLRRARAMAGLAGFTAGCLFGFASYYGLSLELRGVDALAWGILGSLILFGVVMTKISSSRLVGFIAYFGALIFLFAVPGRSDMKWAALCGMVNGSITYLISRKFTAFDRVKPLVWVTSCVLGFVLVIEGVLIAMIEPKPHGGTTTQVNGIATEPPTATDLPGQPSVSRPPPVPAPRASVQSKPPQQIAPQPVPGTQKDSLPSTNPREIPAAVKQPKDPFAGPEPPVPKGPYRSIEAARERLQQSHPQILRRIDTGFPLSVDQIVTLANIGVRDDAIVQYIRASDVMYRLSSTEIQLLREAGLSDRVIKEMLRKAENHPAPQSR